MLIRHSFNGNLSVATRLMLLSPGFLLSLSHLQVFHTVMDTHNGAWDNHCLASVSLQLRRIMQQPADSMLLRPIYCKCESQAVSLKPIIVQSVSNSRSHRSPAPVMCEY